jgi:hypothetical protein
LISRSRNRSYHHRPPAAGREHSIIARLKRRFLYGLILGVAVIAAVTPAGMLSRSTGD